MFAIEVNNLSKQYRLGGAGESRYKTVRDAVGRLSERLWKRTSGPRPVREQTLWALRDVSFEVPEGQAIGIIGRNGAGKSTLLKILSRITEPTGGRALLRGRVASLLEVGTGFHPELTGRENVLLNGAILGMSRAEVARQFDEIVAFAEVEKFLDTPVKHYSSGMYVRLAFAVAAHLTPEILIVDEVLAVGDFEFQRRCLGRMNAVARSGRTVLFVSHSMHAVESLCSQTLLMSQGRVERLGTTKEVIAHYLCRQVAAGEESDLTRIKDREGTGRGLITRVQILSADGNRSMDSVPFGLPFRVRIHYHAHGRIVDPLFGLSLMSEDGDMIFMSTTADVGCTIPAIEGTGWCDCLVAAPNVLPGTYRFDLWMSDVRNLSHADHLRMVGKVEITVGDGNGRRLHSLTFRPRGYVFLDCAWVPNPGTAPGSVEALPGLLALPRH